MSYQVSILAKPDCVNVKELLSTELTLHNAPLLAAWQYFMAHYCKYFRIYRHNKVFLASNS